jgi:curved DNA-binding protein CbpA
MTDYFAILDQPRQPWLDEEAIKSKYQELTLAQHPDVETKSGDRNFAEVTEAYRVLSHPKLRLSHLLQLANVDLPRQQQIPEELAEWFSRVGSFVQSADRVVARGAGASSAVALSLTRAEMAGLEPEAKRILAELKQRHHESLRELQTLNASWSSNLPALTNLYPRLAFLGRWIEQVEQRLFQLSS